MYNIDNFADQGAWLPFCFIISPLECRGCAMPEGVTALTQIVISNSWGFLGTFNGNYDLVIIGVHAVTKSYFIVHNALSIGLKIYHVTRTCLKCVCRARYTVISALCILAGRRICSFPVFYQPSYVGLRRNQFLTNMLLPTQHTVRQMEFT